MKHKQTPYQFFKEHAGYSYGPGETPEQGRRKTARALADAERRASDAGVSFEWIPDSEPFECACDDPTCESHDPHQAYSCIARKLDGTVFASLGAVSFGPGRDPWMGDAYRRVVEAELALEFDE